MHLPLTKVSLSVTTHVFVILYPSTPLLYTEYSSLPLLLFAINDNSQLDRFLFFDAPLFSGTTSFN